MCRFAGFIRFESLFVPHIMRLVASFLIQYTKVPVYCTPSPHHTVRHNFFLSLSQKFLGQRRLHPRVERGRGMGDAEEGSKRKAGEEREEESWYSNGFFPPPTLLRSGEERDVSWSELFFDLVFVVTFARSGEYLTDELNESGDPMAVARYLALVLNAGRIWVANTAYMTRYGTDDLFHKLVTPLFMLGLCVMSIHLEGLIESFESLNFVPLSVGALWCSVVLVFLWLRVAYHKSGSLRYQALFLGAVPEIFSVLGWTLIIAGVVPVDGLIVRAGTDALFHATLADFFPPLRVASDEHGRACAMPQAILV